MYKEVYMMGDIRFIVLTRSPELFERDPKTANIHIQPNTMANPFPEPVGPLAYLRVLSPTAGGELSNPVVWLPSADPVI